MPDGSIEKLTKYRQAVTEQERQEQWEEVQEQFHKAMAYFPEYTELIDSCPACVVAESFSSFPLIAQHSPCHPVITAKIYMDDDSPEVTPFGGYQRASLPCYVVKFMNETSVRQIERRIRELALVALNGSSLPPMPVTELEKIKKKLIPGQRIARDIYLSCRNAPTEEDITKLIVRRRVTSAIVLVISLRDLIRIVYYHPGAIDEERAKVLHQSLVESLEGAMNHDELSAVRLIYSRPEYGDRFAETDLGEVLEMLVLHHQQTISGDGSLEHIEKAAYEILKECTDIVPAPIMELAREISFARSHRCGVPRPADDPTFVEKGRFIQMIGHYWSICKKVIVYQLGARMYDPDVITRLMDDLQARIDANFAILGSFEGAADAQQALSVLIDTCTSTDWKAEPKKTRGMIREVDTFLKRANAALRRRDYPLISEEQMFFRQVHLELERFHAFLDEKWKEMSIQHADDLQKDKIVIEQREVEGKLHLYMNGVDRGAFPFPPKIVIGSILEALDIGAIERQLVNEMAGTPKKKPRKRASRATTIDAIKLELREHLRAARDHAFYSRDHGSGAALLPRPSQKQLAAQLNIHPSSISRAINDPSDEEIRILWKAANNLKQVMKF